jgi:hypothetical protein
MMCKYEAVLGLAISQRFMKYSERLGAGRNLPIASHWNKLSFSTQDGLRQATWGFPGLWEFVTQSIFIKILLYCYLIERAQAVSP